MRGRARRAGDVLFGSAGWLFADLMLAVVVMLFLAAALAAPAEDEASAPTSDPAPPTTTTTTTTTPPPSPPPPPRLLPQPIAVPLRVNTNALLRNDRATIGRMRQDVRRALAGPLAGRRAGVVLTFGSGPGNDFGRGVQVARQFNSQVLQRLGGQFDGSAYRAYFQNDEPLDVVYLEIFVFG